MLEDKEKEANKQSQHKLLESKQKEARIQSQPKLLEEKNSDTPKQSKEQPNYSKSLKVSNTPKLEEKKEYELTQPELLKSKRENQPEVLTDVETNVILLILRLISCSKLCFILL